MIRQEIGQQAVEPKKVEAMETDLKANPPRPFDLTRRLTVFISEVQFVEPRLSNAVLSSRKIRLPPHFLKFNNAALRKEIKSTLRIPVDFSEKLDVTFNSHLGEEKLTKSKLKRSTSLPGLDFKPWTRRGKG